jgi:hypothetical protein
VVVRLAAGPLLAANCCDGCEFDDDVDDDDDDAVDDQCV